MCIENGGFCMEKRMNLLSLTWPIFIENVLFMLLGFIDIFVLSRYNDIAASAVSAIIMQTARCQRLCMANAPINSRRKALGR